LEIYSFYFKGGIFFSFIYIVFTKSAQLPFGNWLPKAIRAPTPTRALVHRSTLVTAGLVVIFNYVEVFIQHSILVIILISGFITILSGSLLSLIEMSVKKIVAYRTISQIGLCIITYGLGNFYTGFINLVVHGFTKSLLFIQIGFLIHSFLGQQNRKG